MDTVHGIIGLWVETHVINNMYMYMAQMCCCIIVWFISIIHTFK